MAKKKSAAKSTTVPVEAHKHPTDKRPNIPTRETAAFATDTNGQPFVVQRPQRSSGFPAQSPNESYVSLMPFDNWEGPA
jgi:hypothetical protein